MPNNLQTYKITSLTSALVERWIKNVYNLRTQTGIKSDELYTNSQLTNQFTKAPVHNSPVTPLFVQVLATQFSTSKITQFDLLHNNLYPQSTPPINKKKKRILGRNT